MRLFLRFSRADGRSGPPHLGTNRTSAKRLRTHRPMHRAARGKWPRLSRLAWWEAVTGRFLEPIHVVARLATQVSGEVSFASVSLCPRQNTEATAISSPPARPVKPGAEASAVGAGPALGETRRTRGARRAVAGVGGDQTPSLPIHSCPGPVKRRVAIHRKFGPGWCAESRKVSARLGLGTPRPGHRHAPTGGKRWLGSPSSGTISFGGRAAMPVVSRCVPTACGNPRPWRTTSSGSSAKIMLACCVVRSCRYPLLYRHRDW
jgi:hypothetical protein